MASLLSPGVISREIDLTTATPAVASTEGGIVVDAQWGPAEKLVLVTDEVDLVDVFGKPNSSNAERWFTAKNFLSYSGALYVSRAINSNALNSSSSGSGTLIKNLDELDNATGTPGEYAARYPGALGNSLKISLADSSTLSSWAYKTNFSGDLEKDELHIVVVDEGGLFTGTKGSILEKYEYVSKFSDSKNEDGSSNYYKKVINDKSEYVYVLDKYSTMSGWGGSSSEYITLDSVTGKSSHVSRDTEKQIMLSYELLETDPGSVETYTLTLEKKKKLRITLAADAGLTAESFAAGDSITHKNQSDNSTDNGTVLSWDLNSLRLEVFPFDGTFWTAPVDPSDVNKVVKGGSEYDINGEPAQADKDFEANDFTAGGAITNQSGVAGTIVQNDAETGVDAWTPATGVLIVTSEGPLESGDVISGFNVSSVTSIPAPADDPILITAEHSLSGGSDSTVLADDIVSAYDLFADEELVDISFLIAGPDELDPNEDSRIVQKVFEIVSSRQDCLGVMSPPKDACLSSAPFADIQDYRGKLNVGSLRDLKGSFMVMDDNWKYQFDKYNNVNRWVPCCGDTAGLMAETDSERAAWFSPGGRSLKNVIKLAWKSKKSERDVLYPMGVNSITTFPGEGAILYGDRTMLRRPSAFDRINVRRLFIVLRKTISRTARSFLFENNTSYTRERFKSTIVPFLEEVQGRQGITEFKVVCDDTNNTGQIIDENRFIGDIYIKPSRSVNFIELNFVAVRTDVEFSEIVGSV